MKTCAYCGRANDEEATQCAECGALKFKTASLQADKAASEAQGRQANFREILSNPVGLFRTLVVVSTTSYLLWFFQFYLFEQFISEDIYEVLSWQGFDALLRTPESMMWLFMLLYAALAIGLWNFSKSARLVFSSLLIFEMLLSWFLGVQIQTALSGSLSYISNLADGAILVMAYTSPLKNKFV